MLNFSYICHLQLPMGVLKAPSGLCFWDARLRLPFFFLKEVRFNFSSGPVHYSQDPPQTSFLKKNFIKNGSYGTIYIFKNYFIIVFSVFSFQQNKRYPNGSWVQIRTNNNLYIRFVMKILQKCYKCNTSRILYIYIYLNNEQRTIKIKNKNS